MSAQPHTPDPAAGGWKVVVWSADPASRRGGTPTVSYQGSHAEAQHVFYTLANTGARVELRYQPPPVIAPEHVIVVANHPDAPADAEQYVPRPYVPPLEPCPRCATTSANCPLRSTQRCPYDEPAQR